MEGKTVRNPSLGRDRKQIFFQRAAQITTRRSRRTFSLAWPK
jgi:hypothetical protein